MKLMTRRVSFPMIGAAIAALRGSHPAHAQETTPAQDGFKTGDIMTCHELENCIAGQMMPLTSEIHAGKGVMIQGADCCWRYLAFPQQCKPKLRTDGAGPPIIDVENCLCDPGQVRVVPELAGSTRDAVYYQGVDCAWYPLSAA